MEEEPGADGAVGTTLEYGGCGLETGVEENKPQPRPPRPNRCRRYARQRTAEAMPAIVTELVTQAKAGSVAHTKLLLSLSGIDQEKVSQPRPRRTKGVVGQLLDELEQEGKLQQDDRTGIVQ